MSEGLRCLVRCRAASIPRSKSHVYGQGHRSEEAVHHFQKRPTPLSSPGKQPLDERPEGGAHLGVLVEEKLERALTAHGYRDEVATVRGQLRECPLRCTVPSRC
jgi:hypothetical protein